MLLCKTKSLPGEDWKKLEEKGGSKLYLENNNVEHFSDGSMTIWVKIIHDVPKKDGTSYSLSLMQIDCNSNKYKFLWTGAYDSQGNITDVPLGPAGPWLDVNPMNIPAAISVIHCQAR